AAQRSAAAVSQAMQAAKDAGYQLDVLLESRETTNAAGPAEPATLKAGGKTVSTKTTGTKTTGTKPAGTKTKSANSEDGASAPATEEKAIAATPKKPTKKTTSGKRKR
ncbi:MAG TPA: hypothetical protein VF018_16200, partial [Acidobacteriaceae bacterium]